MGHSLVYRHFRHLLFRRLRHGFHPQPQRRRPQRQLQLIHHGLEQNRRRLTRLAFHRHARAAGFASTFILCFKEYQTDYFDSHHLWSVGALHPDSSLERKAVFGREGEYGGGVGVCV